MNTMIAKVITGMMILGGVYMIALYLVENLGWWVLLVGNALLIIGLDFRFGTVRVDARIAIEEKINELRK